MRLGAETILRPGSNNFSVRVRVGVRFAFKLLIQSRTPVSERNIDKRFVRILYMIRINHGLWLLKRSRMVTWISRFFRSNDNWCRPHSGHGVGL